MIPQVAPTRLWALVSGLIGASFACSSIVGKITSKEPSLYSKRRVGPVLGGVITEKAGWRWIYLFNAPAAAVIIIPFLLAWPKTRKTSNQTRRLLLSQMDVPGALLLLTASTLLLFALQQAGGNRETWGSAAIIASLVIGSICWILFFSWSFFLEFGNTITNINLKPIFPLSVALHRPTGPAIL